MGNKGSVLGEDELADFVTKTKFTREQILSIRVQFLAKDKDHTDGLTLPEFKEFFGYLQSPNDPEQLDRLFALYDKDKDGQVSLGELLITLGIFCNGTLDQKLGLFFDLYDENHNGALEPKEAANLNAYIFAAARILNKDPAELPELKSFDVNHDGVISKKEWMMAASRDAKLAQLLLGAK